MKRSEMRSKVQGQMRLLCVPDAVSRLRECGRRMTRKRPSGHGEDSAFRGLILIVEFDVLVEDDFALLVAHDVIAVQAVAILVEIVFALGALVAFGGKDGVADFVGISR